MGHGDEADRGEAGGQKLWPEEGSRVSDLRKSGDGVRLGLLADAQTKAFLTREAEGTLEDKLAGTGTLAPTYWD